MREDEINKIINEVTSKYYKNLFHTFFSIRDIQAKNINLSIPAFSSYTKEQIMSMLPPDPNDRSKVKFLMEGTTQDLGLCYGYYMGTELDLPKDNNLGIEGTCYLFEAFFSMKGVEPETVFENADRFTAMLFTRAAPFNLLEAHAPIFAVIIVLQAEEEIQGTGELLSCGAGPSFPDDLKDNNYVCTTCIIWDPNAQNQKKK